MKKKKQERKCYSCRQPVKGTALFCSKCEKDPKARKHTMGTYIIYTSV